MSTSPRTYLALLALLSSVASPGRAQTAAWTDESVPRLEAAHGAFVACAEDTPEAARCNRLVVEALEAIHCTDEVFGGAASAAPWYASDVAEALPSAAGWERLGPADDQAVLVRSQAAANAGRVVVALLPGPGAGHLAVVIPGDLSPSASWESSVPSSASFFLNGPERSYVGKPLSYAFGSPEHVTLWAREYSVCGAG